MADAPARRKANSATSIGQIPAAIARRDPQDSPATDELWRRHETGGEAATNALCEHYAPLAFMHAYLMKRARPEFYRDELDDLVSDGLLVLLECLRQRPPYLGPGEWRQFIKRKIRRGIRRCVLRRSWMGEREVKRQEILGSMRAQFVSQHGRMPTRDEMLAGIGDQLDNPHFSIGYQPAIGTLGLSSKREPNRSERAMDAPMIDADTMRLAMKGMKSEDRRVLRMVLKGMSGNAIARELGISSDVAWKRVNGVLWMARTNAQLAEYLGVEPIDPCTVNLSPRRMQAIDLLAQGKSNTETAAAMGIHRTNVTEWKGEIPFLAQLQRRREELQAAERSSVSINRAG